MNRDDIIRMARGAGFVRFEKTYEWCCSSEELVGFAELVVAAEREKDTALLLKCLAALESGRPDIRHIAIERLRARLEGEK